MSEQLMPRPVGSRRRGRPARLGSAIAALCLTLLASGFPPGARAVAEDGAAEVLYRLPASQPAPILRGFDAVGRYDAGHRGVDVGSAPGGLALAAADGAVVFAGPVAGRGVVVVQHGDGIRTTYEPVAASVAEGQRVSAGDPLGPIVGAHGDFPADAALHWGARRGEDYVDPLALLRRLGPVRLVL